MIKLRDLLLGIGLVAALALGLAAHRALAGNSPALEALLAAPGAAVALGLVVGAASVGYRGRSRLAAALGGAAGAGLAGLHTGLASAAGLANLPVLVSGGLASGIAAYLGYLAILPPAPEPPEPEGE